MSGADLQDSELIVLTGMSGAGRTTAARALEDVGWFVIDNIPPTLLLEALELASDSSDIKKVAVVVDTRSRSLFAQLRSVMADLSLHVGSVTTVFLEATDESLVRRFESDMVADVRFLPNPFWDEDLRQLTGRDRAVSENVLQGSGAQDFLTHFQELLGTMREGYLREGKRLVTVAVGCTGGKHRSVAMTEELATMLGETGHRASVFHRDLGRE